MKETIEIYKWRFSYKPVDKIKISISPENLKLEGKYKIVHRKNSFEDNRLSFTEIVNCKVFRNTVFWNYELTEYGVFFDEFFIPIERVEVTFCD